MQRNHIYKIILIFGLLIFPSTSVSAKNIALVVGNDKYQNLVNLQKAVNDAISVAQTLEGIGFTVFRGINLTRRDLNHKLAEFEQNISPGDRVFFFFAGHGVALGPTNFLIPIDMPLPRAGQERLISREAFAVDEIVAGIQERGASAVYVVLDACRNNPFKTGGNGRSIGASRGLRNIAAPKGVFILFSAGIGQEALDRLGEQDLNQNSVFTRNLLPLLKTPGLSHVQLAKMVQSSVDKLARTVNHEQQPAYYDQVIGEMYLVAGNKTIESLETKSRIKTEFNAEGVYRSVENSKNLTVLQAFVEEFPEGIYTTLIRTRINEIGNSKSASLSFKEPKTVLPSAGVITDCDRLAGSPLDPEKLTTGVKFDEIDAATAIPLCRLALKTSPNQPRIIFQLARALAKNKQYSEFFPLMKVAAEKGHVRASYWIGMAFDEGENTGKGVVLKSDIQALKWYLKAARKGDGDAMFKVASFYGEDTGEGNEIEKSENKALKWFLRASEKGIAGAMYSAGYMYAYGAGIAKPDYKNSAVYIFMAIQKQEEYVLEVMEYESLKWPKEFRLELQRKLKKAGYYDGVIDGIFGSETIRSINALANL